MTRGLLHILIILTLSAPSLAAADVVPNPSTPAKPMKICREGGERATGSHIRTGRRCMTADQWEAEDRRRDQKPLTMQVTEGQDVPTKPPR